MNNFIIPEKYREFLILNGESIEADIAYNNIYSLANKSIYVIDNYINLKTLILLKNINNNVKVIVFTDNINKGLHRKELDDFNSEDFSCKSTFVGHKGDIKMVKFCPLENNVFFSCGFDDCIKIWEEDKDDYVEINTLKEHSGTVWYIEFNKKGDIFFTCSDDKFLIMWGIGNKDGDNNDNIIDYDNIIKLSKINNVHLRPIYSCILSFNEKYIFTCSNDGNIGIIKIIENKEDKNYELSLVNIIKDAHEQYSVNSICTNKNEVISCGDDCCIKIWKFEEIK